MNIDLSPSVKIGVSYSTLIWQLDSLYTVKGIVLRD